MIQVIIVEDDPMVSELNRRYLAAVPEIHVAGQFQDGSSGLEYILNHRVDLIILDTYLPQMNGIEFLKIIRSKNMSPDVIMITADNSKETFESAYHLGIIDYLVKPFEYQRLIVAIQRFLQKRSLLQAASDLGQSEIDSFMQISPAPASILQKGLQKNTLRMIKEYLMSNTDKEHTNESLAEQTGLSKVTIRRYMNYLAETQEVVSVINYETGGRPCVIYKLV